VPVLQGGQSNGVTILYKEFGVRLRYTPVVTANRTIKLALAQEVSSLDYTNATILNGFTIPALSTRRAETNVELGEGETFAIAGLLDNRDLEIFSKIPGVSSIPIIGNLFKNKRTEQTQKELIMLVTPEITMPLDPKRWKRAGRVRSRGRGRKRKGSRHLRGARGRYQRECASNRRSRHY
jgi:pilus assembly protein CpaC